MKPALCHPDPHPSAAAAAESPSGSELLAPGLRVSPGLFLGIWALSEKIFGYEKE